MSSEHKESKEGLNPQEGSEYLDPVDTLTTELMIATKHGDREAFNRLTETLRSRAFRVASSLVGSREDALEMAQEAFLKTYKARETFRESEPFLPWFHRILRNTCFTFLRKRGRIRLQSTSFEKDGEEGQFQLVDEGPAPFEASEKNEAVNAFYTCYKTLSARDREILAMRHFEDMAYREIARALDIPEGTVMSRLFHARRRLRDALEPHLSGALEDYAQFNESMKQEPQS